MGAICGRNVPPGSKYASLPALKQLIDILPLGATRMWLLQDVFATNYNWRSGKICGFCRDDWFSSKHMDSSFPEEFRTTKASTFFHHIQLENITDDCQLILTPEQYEQLAEIVVGQAGVDVSWRRFLKRSQLTFLRNSTHREKNIAKYNQQKFFSTAPHC
jgi:hypothetical protein